MRALPTRLDGPILIEPVVHGDERGFFHETYRRNVYAELGHPRRVRPGQPLALAQGHRAGNALPDRRGTSKLVRCARGAIVDVLVDLRKGSPTFGEWEAFELNDAEPAPALLPDRIRARVRR